MVQQTESPADIADIIVSMRETKTVSKYMGNKELAKARKGLSDRRFKELVQSIESGDKDLFPVFTKSYFK